MDNKTPEQIADELLAAAGIGQSGKKAPGRKPKREKVARDQGAVLLDQVRKFLVRFIAYPSEHAAIAHVLWIAHSHLMSAWESTPRIAFLSPEPASGKTNIHGSHRIARS